MKLILPDPLLFGYWASAPFPWLIIVAKSHKDNAALIAHEQCHQDQQRRDGLLRFWWRYTTNKAWRMAYEVDAYKAWLDVAPHDEWRVSYMLAHNYGFDLSVNEAKELLISH
jgi:hypothetical protein